MSKVLYISESFAPFVSSWGSWATPQSLGDGFILPCGFEKELDIRNITHEVIDLVNHREALTEELIQAATAFGLGEFISVLFFNLRTLIRDFEQNGGTGLYEFFQNISEGDEGYAVLFSTNEDGVSPRDYALELLKDYKP